MAIPAIADMVYQNSTSSGTGNLSLTAVNGRRSFASAFGTGVTTNVFYYFIGASNGSAFDEWEVGTGHMSNSTTLVRDTVIASSNSNALVNFSGGILDVMNDVRAADQYYANKPLSIALTSGSTSKAISTSQTGPTTSQAGPFIYNQIAITDDTPAATDTRTMGLYMQYNTGGANGLGGKYGAFFNMNHNVNSATGGDHIALVSQMYSTVTDTSGGELYAESIATVLDGGSTVGINGLEVDISMKNSATATRRMGLRVVNDVGTQRASSQDAAYAILNKTAGGEFKTGFLLSKYFGQSPIATTGDWFGLDAAQTITNVFNCSSLTVSGNIFDFPGLRITGAGAATLGGGAANTGVQLQVSRNSSALPVPAGGPTQIGQANGSPNITTLDSFGTGTFTAYSEIDFRRANGTAASPSAVQSGDLIALFGGIGYGASAYSSVARAQLRFLADENWTGTAQGESIRFLTTATGGTTTAEMMAVTGSAVLLTGVGTTASAANAFINNAASNSLLRSTSSLTYKTDIEPLDAKIASDTIRQLKPIWYRSKAAADRKDWSWYGLGAEDVAKIDPRLVHWGYQDDAYETVVTEDGTETKKLKDGAELVPDGVMYERLVCHLISVVQDMSQRLDKLSAIDSKGSQ